MKQLCILAGTLLLIGCGPTSSESDENARIKESAAKDREARVEAQQFWAGLISKRQGCFGRILQGEELLKVVLGNRIMNVPIEHVVYPPNYPIVSRSYFPNGRLASTVQFNDPFGRYWIEGQKLCHWNLHGMGDVKWCLRLILSPDNRLMEELIDDRDNTHPRLACVPIKIDKLEGEL